MDSGQFFPELSEELLSQAADVLAGCPDLFRRMDRAYAKAAAGHEFTCTGCEDNCCHTWFFHHTLVEGLYLAQGAAKLAPGALAEAEKRAAEIIERAAGHVPEQGPFRAPCPLFAEGMCTLYEHRPMICRLHGISYRLFRPGGNYAVGPGCAEFDRASRNSLSKKDLLDRTPLYTDMAKMETRMRKALDLADRTRYTVAGLLAGGAAWNQAVAFFRELRASQA